MSITHWGELRNGGALRYGCFLGSGGNTVWGRRMSGIFGPSTNAILGFSVEMIQKLRRTLNAMKLRSANDWRPAEPM
jgi:hypothetical protein